MNTTCILTRPSPPARPDPTQSTTFYARGAHFTLRNPHKPSAALTCARAMCPQAGALAFVAAGGALAREAPARLARLRHDPFLGVV